VPGERALKNSAKEEKAHGRTGEKPGPVLQNGPKSTHLDGQGPRGEGRGGGMSDHLCLKGLINADRGEHLSGPPGIRKLGQVKLGRGGGVNSEKGGESHMMWFTQKRGGV